MQKLILIQKNQNIFKKTYFDMIDEDKKIIQDVIDRLLYIEDYKDKLIALNERHDPHKKTKYTTNINDFRFPLDKAI